MFSTTNVFLSLSFVLLWSSGWIGGKFAVDQVAPFTFLSWRYAIVVFILAACVLLRGQWRPLTSREYVHHMTVGVLSHGVYLGASLYAMQAGVSAGMVALITSMQPLITSVIAQNYSSEKANRTQWLGVFLGVLAVCLIVIDQITVGGSLFAYLLLFVAVLALCCATHFARSTTLSTRTARVHSAPLLQIMFIHSCAALAFFSVFALSLEGQATQWTSSLVGTLLYLAVIVSIGSYGLLFLLLQRLPAVEVSSLAYLTQGTTMLMAWFVLGETLTALQWMGLILATSSVFLVHLNKVEVTQTKARGHLQFDQHVPLIRRR